MSKHPTHKQIRFATLEQVQLIGQAIELLNADAEVGVKATFNRFVNESAEKEARRIIEKYKGAE